MTKLLRKNGHDRITQRSEEACPYVRGKRVVSLLPFSNYGNRFVTFCFFIPISYHKSIV